MLRLVNGKQVTIYKDQFGRSYEVMCQGVHIGAIDLNSSYGVTVTWYDGVTCFADFNSFECALEFLVDTQAQPTIELSEDENGLIF